MSSFRYVFGPTPSRRFGRSLGIDLTPPKTCSFDCVFCQLGRTTHLTVERREYVPTQAVIEEIRAWFEHPLPIDVATLAGTGEPTLHSKFGEVLRALRKYGARRTLLLSNGSLFHDPDVRRAAAEADTVKVSLSAWDDASLQRINRPHSALRFRRIMEGLEQFRSEYPGELHLEVFLVPGINTAPEQVRRIAEYAARIRPDRIELNTAVRPPAEPDVRAVSREEMEAIALMFEPKAEVIGEFHTDALPRFHAELDAVAATLRRRPCSSSDLSGALGLHPNQTAKYIARLQREGKIRPVEREGEVIWIWAPSGDAR